VDAPTAERLSYVEGLRLQSAPQLGDPDFVDHRNPVRGVNSGAKRVQSLCKAVPAPGRAGETQPREVVKKLLRKGDRRTSSSSRRA